MILRSILIGLLVLVVALVFFIMPRSIRSFIIFLGIMGLIIFGLVQFFKRMQDRQTWN